MRKLDMNQVVYQLNGEPWASATPDQPATLRFMLDQAVSSMRTDPAMTTEVKQRIYAVGKKLWSSRWVQFSSEEIVLLKERCDAVYDSPVMYGRVADLLEGIECDAPTPDAEDEPQTERAPARARRPKSSSPPANA